MADPGRPEGPGPTAARPQEGPGPAGAQPRPRRAALLGLAAVGVLQVWLATRTALPGGITVRRYALLADIAAWWAAFAVACLCVRALPRRTAVLVVLGLAVAVRVAAMAPTAPLSDDLYRYAWDGLVQSAGVNPYLHPPDAEALRPLRHVEGGQWLWPPERAGRPSDTIINRSAEPTIYPPVAQAWFLLEHHLVPLTARDRGYQAVGLCLDLAVLAALWALLVRRGRDPRWGVCYALAPLPVLESVQNAHVDTLALLPVLAALAVRRPAGAAALLGVAALVKVYPGVLLVLLLRERPARLRVVAAALCVAVAAYLPHVLDVGVRVLGYLPGYLREEQYDAGTRYLLVGLLGLRGPPATVVVLGALAVLAVVLLRSDLPLADAGVRLMVGVQLLVTPVQPWYALLLLALAALAGAWWAVPVAAAAYPLFFVVICGDAVVSAQTAGRLSYGAAALVVAGAAVVERRRRAAPARRPARGRAR